MSTISTSESLHTQGQVILYIFLKLKKALRFAMLLISKSRISINSSFIKIEHTNWNTLCTYSEIGFESKVGEEDSINKGFLT